MKPLDQCTNTVFNNIIDPKRKIETYLTGKFPYKSNRVNKYLFVLYNHDINSILVLPMEAGADSEFIWIFKYLQNYLLTRGLDPSYV